MFQHFLPNEARDLGRERAIRSCSPRCVALTLALLAALLAGGWLLRPAAAQTSTIAVEIARIAVDTRVAAERAYYYWLEPVPRVNDLIISGPVTVRISAAASVTPPALSNLSATNATLSNFQTVTANEAWTVDVTPTANGPVTISLPQQGTRGGASLSMTAELGAPKVIWADITSANGGTHGPYVAGDAIDVSVIYSEHVVVSGMPTVELRTDTSTPAIYDATYHSGSGSSVLVFRHTIPAGGYTRVSTTINSSVITLPASASIAESGANGAAAGLTLPTLMTRIERFVASAQSGVRAPSNEPGDEYDYLLVFDEPVTVHQEPDAELPWLRVRINTNAGTATEVRAVYAGGSGTNELTFRYTVRAGDNLSRVLGLVVPRLHIPEGIGIRNAAGIDVYARASRPQSTTTGVEGTRLQLSFSLTTGLRDDITLRFTSDDPDRLSIERASFPIKSAEGPEPNDWLRPRNIVMILHHDSDIEDNYVTVRWLFESASARYNGITGTYIRVRIFDNDRGTPTPANLALEISLVDDSDSVVSSDSELTIAAKLVYTDRYQELIIPDHGVLYVVGNLEWEINGRKRLTIYRQRTTNLGEAGTCTSAALDGLTTWTCKLRTEDSTIVIPAGASDGVFTVSGQVEIGGVTYDDSLDVTIGDVDEVASVALDFATDIAPGDSTDTSTNNQSADDRPYPSMIAAGESTTLRLTILNENDAASAAGSLDSVLLTATAGSLSLLNPVGDCQGGGGSVCQVPVSLLNAENSDEILINLAHSGPSRSGAARIQATVIAKDGETFISDPIMVTFLGPAETLAISEPTSGLLSAAAEEDDERSLLKLTVTATDAAGNSVDVPYRAPRAIIRGPDDKVVSSGISAVWTEDGNDADDAHDRFTRNAANAVEATIRVTAAPAAPLKAGGYTLQLRTAALTATREFRVVGETASVALNEPDGELQVADTVSLTATLRDAEGALVPDGTPVRWASNSIGERVVLVQLAADTATTDGTASAKFLAVNAGAAAVSAESNSVRGVTLLRVADESATVATAAESLSNQGAPGAAAWLGAESTSASALLDALDGITSIQLWAFNGWLRYSRSAADSVDSTINPGAVLWLEE